jgi:hypothetical protein
MLALMLERVGVGQTRFVTPGLTLDGRGVVSGRQMIVRFAALDRMISFLRVWSGEQALEDVEPGLRLLYARVSGGPRDALVSLSLPSAMLGDAVARAARLSGGQCFTGAGKHFVQYRDSRAPLGYDVDRLDPVVDPVSLLLYGVDQTWAYSIENEISLEKLLLHLDLQREDRARPADATRDTFFLTVRRGLGPAVLEYLHRTQHKHPALRVSAALCEPPAESVFKRESAFWLLRLTEVPARLYGTLTRTPGLTLFAPVADNVAVAVGYRHPIHLGACRQALPPHRLFLFAPPPRGVIAIDPAPTLTPLADLVRLGGRIGLRIEGVSPPGFRSTPTEPLVVPLRIEAAPAQAARVAAALVPWAGAGWLRALCYALPASALRGYRVAVLERGVLVMAPDVLTGIPFGQLLHAPGPGLLVPLGWEIRPRVSPLELAAGAGATGGAVVVFPGPDEPPFRIPAEAIESLQASALADPRLGHMSVEASIAGPAPPAPAEVEIENHPIGPMPLWGLKS